MTYKKTARITAIIFFVLWLGVMYAGADHPPPPGFILFIIFNLAASWIIYFRVPVYCDWHKNRKSNRLLRISVEGLLAGLAIALITMLTSGGEPSVTPTPIDKVIWFAILGTVGIVNAIFVYYLGVFITKILAKFKRNN